MSDEVFTQFKDDLPVDINKKYYIHKEHQDNGLQEIHKLCLFPSKLSLELKNNIEKLKNEINLTTNIYKLTPLSLSIRNNVEKSIKLLLEYGADVNIQNNYVMCIPLIEACYLNNIKIVKLLLEYGADINIKDVWGDTAMRYTKNFNIDKLLFQYLHPHNMYMYLTNVLPNTCIILSNVNNSSLNFEISIKQLKKLKHFDYNSILLYELKKCVWSEE